MRSWMIGAIMLAGMAVGSTALACPVGPGEGRPIRPVQNGSFQASELVERAARLESVASSHEAQARAFEQEADTLSNRARILRNQAGFVNASDRSSIFASDRGTKVSWGRPVTALVRQTIGRRLRSSVSRPRTFVSARSRWCAAVAVGAGAPSPSRFLRKTYRFRSSEA